MVRIDVVVTRGGDAGETSLGDGARLRKDAARIAAIGGVDEANAAIGVLRLATRDVPDADAMLARIQNDLFDVGADLSVPGEGGDRLRMTDVSVARLEAEVEAMNAALPKLTSFVLPGGSAGRRACAHGAHDRPAGGARCGAAGGGGSGDAGAAALPQPPVGPPVRAGARIERQRCGRRDVGARSQSDTALTNRGEGIAALYPSYGTTEPAR